MSTTVTLPIGEYQRLVEVDKKVKNGPTLNLVVTRDVRFTEDFTNTVTNKEVITVTGEWVEGLMSKLKDAIDTSNEKKKEVYSLIEEGIRLNQKAKESMKEILNYTFLQRLKFLFTKKM